MLKKIVENLIYVGVLALFVGLVLYSVQKTWDLWVRMAVFGGLTLIVLYLAANLGSLLSYFRSRSGRMGSTAGLTVVLVVAILVLVNFLNQRHNKRLDLTENQIHSLSEQSRKMVQNLEGEITVLGFFVDNAEPFTNLMKEYRQASDKVRFEVVDPQADVARTSQYEINRSGQLVVVSAARSQKVDTVSEEAVTNAMIKVTRVEEKTIYFLEGHGERAIDAADEDGYQSIRKAVEAQNYQVESYNLAVEAKLPDDASVIVIPGPKTNLLPHEVTLIQEYLAGGGKLLLLVDPQTGFDQNDFWAGYGVQLEDNVVIDINPLGQLFRLGPAAPLVSSYSFHPITEDLDVTTFFPMARSLRVVDSELGYETRELFSSSRSSWGETDLTEGQEVAFDAEKDLEGPVTLAIVGSLQVQSKTEEDAEEQAGEAPLVEEETTEEIPQREARLVVVGDSDFVTNFYLNVGGGNADLFLNMISWLAEDTDLIAVRPKDPTSRRVTLTERDSSLLFWATVVLLPLATLILGITVWVRRR